MYKTQYKARSPYDTWITVGSYGSEAQAISAALGKKIEVRYWYVC